MKTFGAFLGAIHKQIRWFFAILSIKAPARPSASSKWTSQPEQTAHSKSVPAPQRHKPAASAVALPRTVARAQTSAATFKGQNFRASLGYLPPPKGIVVFLAYCAEFSGGEINQKLP